MYTICLRPAPPMLTSAPSPVVPCPPVGGGDLILDARETKEKGELPILAKCPAECKSPKLP